MNIRQLNKQEYNEAIELSLKLFMECGTADFDNNGLNTFKSFIYNNSLMNELAIFGAFDGNALIGIMGTKKQGQHISLFFINPKYHRKGIGKRLFDYAYSNQTTAQITVNSSSFAVRFYESLGFMKTAEEQETDGLRYTPMIRIRDSQLESKALTIRKSNL